YFSHRPLPMTACPYTSLYRSDNALSVQLSLAGQLRPGPNPLNNASTLALAALARSEQTPQPHRTQAAALAFQRGAIGVQEARAIDRKSTRLNSSHVKISYAVF